MDEDLNNVFDLLKSQKVEVSEVVVIAKFKWTEDHDFPENIRKIRHLATAMKIPFELKTLGGYSDGEVHFRVKQ